MTPPQPPLTVADAHALAEQLVDRVGTVVLGKRRVLSLVLLAVLADGHVLIEDYPGLAKTLIARSFAQVTSMRFTRIQFTPDLTPLDVTGSAVFDQRSGEFSFRPGPMFTNLLLADEVNRAPAKTQAALLEGMEERQITVDGTTRRLEAPFIVLATQNPIEYEGTYPLPEAQLDRFLVRLDVGYPEAEAEWTVLAERLRRGTDEVALDPIVDRQTFVAMQAAVELIHVDADVGRYMVALTSHTRSHPSVQVGASPRGSLALLKLARANALLEGRDFVVPDDVKSVAVPALAHRLILRPEVWVRDVRGGDVVAECLESVPTPVQRGAGPR